MKLDILAFGIAKDIVGGSSVALDFGGKTVLELKQQILDSYPKFEALHSLAIAVNNEYAEDAQLIHANDEVVLIPPVSGG